MHGLVVASEALACCEAMVPRGGQWGERRNHRAHVARNMMLDETSTTKLGMLSMKDTLKIKIKKLMKVTCMFDQWDYWLVPDLSAEDVGGCFMTFQFNIGQPSARV